jgi:hypothetical protein
MRLLAALMVVVLALAGCASGLDESVEQIRSAATQYLGAVYRGDGRAACALMTPEGRQHEVRSYADDTSSDGPGQASCAQTVASDFAGQPLFHVVKVEHAGLSARTEVDYEHASSASGTSLTLGWVRRGNRWLTKGFGSP